MWLFEKKYFVVSYGFSAQNKHMQKSSDKTLKILGKKIQKLRKNEKISQEELAHKLGISRTYMGYIEQGRESPSLKLLMKITRRFDVNIEDLFHR